MQCEQTEKVAAYHDGEMDAGPRAAFEAHLIACGVCAGELDELRRLSARLLMAEIPAVSAAGMKRFHGAVTVNEERGVLRLAEWLTAAAAALLLVGITGLFRSETTHASAPATWEQAAVAYPVDAEAPGRAEMVQIAEWIRTDLSGGDGRGGRR